MDIFSVDINHIVELATQVGTSGTIRAGEVMADEIFEYIIAVAVLIYETNP